MRINEAGIELVKSFEQCRLVAYLPTPDDVPTLGWGHTQGVEMGDTCTQEMADQWLMEDLRRVENCIHQSVSADLTENEFAALCSFVYNVGCGAFLGSTLLRLINDGRIDEASFQFSRWSKQNGKVLAGLTRRRAAEAALFIA